MTEYVAISLAMLKAYDMNIISNNKNSSLAKPQYYLWARVSLMLWLRWGRCTLQIFRIIATSNNNLECEDCVCLK